MGIRKETWLKVKNELCTDDKKVHEDIDLAIHLKKYGEIYFEPDVVVYRYLEEESDIILPHFY